MVPSHGRGAKGSQQHGIRSRIHAAGRAASSRCVLVCDSGRAPPGSGVGTGDMHQPACPHGPARASSPAQPLLGNTQQQPGQPVPPGAKGASLPGPTLSGLCRACCSPRQGGQWPILWSEPPKGLGATFLRSWASQGHHRQAGEHCAAPGGWGRINQGKRSWAAQGPTTRSGWH